MESVLAHFLWSFTLPMKCLILKWKDMSEKKQNRLLSSNTFLMKFLYLILSYESMSGKDFSIICERGNNFIYAIWITEQNVWHTLNLGSLMFNWVMFCTFQGKNFAREWTNVTQLYVGKNQPSPPPPPIVGNFLNPGFQ